jgi:hypothetical protein
MTDRRVSEPCRDASTGRGVEGVCVRERVCERVIERNDHD